MRSMFLRLLSGFAPLLIHMFMLVPMATTLGACDDDETSNTDNGNGDENPANGDDAKPAGEGDDDNTSDDAGGGTGGQQVSPNIAPEDIVARFTVKDPGMSGEQLIAYLQEKGITLNEEVSQVLKDRIPLPTGPRTWSVVVVKATAFIEKDEPLTTDGLLYHARERGLDVTLPQIGPLVFAQRGEDFPQVVVVHAPYQRSDSEYGRRCFFTFLQDTLGGVCTPTWLESRTFLFVEEPTR